MGFNSYLKFVFLASLLFYCINAFRLVHPPSHDSKVKLDQKESAKKIDSIPAIKKFEDEIKTKVNENKVKPVESTVPNIKEKILSVKLTKTDDEFEKDEREKIERKSRIIKIEAPKIKQPIKDIIREDISKKFDKITADTSEENEEPIKKKEQVEQKSRIIKIETPKIKQPIKVIKEDAATKFEKVTDDKSEENEKAIEEKEQIERKSRIIKIETSKVKQPTKDIEDIIAKRVEKKADDKSEDQEPTKEKEIIERKSKIIKIETPKVKQPTKDIIGEDIAKKIEKITVEKSEEDKKPIIEKEQIEKKSRIIKIDPPEVKQFAKTIDKEEIARKIERPNEPVTKKEEMKEEESIKRQQPKREEKSIEDKKIEIPKVAIKIKKPEEVKKIEKLKEEKKVEKGYKIIEKKADKLKEEKKVDKPKVETNVEKLKEETKVKETKHKKEEVKSLKIVEQAKDQQRHTQEESKTKINKIVFNSSITSLYFNLPSFSPNFDIVENEECRNQGHILIDQLKNHKLWALRMLDATAKIPSGILKGNLNQLGDYDQCVAIFAKIPIDDKKESEVKISGKYCLAYIDLNAEIQEMKLPVHLAQSRALIRSKLHDPGHFIPQFTTIRWGLCIPSGCSAEDAERILEDSIKTYNESENIGINFDVSIDESQCHIQKPSKKVMDYNYGTLITLGLTATIILFASIATIRDMTPTENVAEIGKMEKILMSFSFKRTIKSLLQESDPNEINCIHGVRTICTFMLYIAHKLIPIGHLPFTNKITLTELSNNPLSIILRLSLIYTDSFLLLSGVLTSYSMSKDMEEKRFIPWFNRIVARFVRLTPPLFFVLLYYAYILDILGEGPLWGTIITSNVKLCEESWWRNILYIQNFYPFQEMCATHTHQLALDMQLSIIAPILVWLLYKKPLLGVFITVLLHSISVCFRYYTTINYRLSLVIYHGISMSQLYRTANMLYASSMHRATPYIAGVGLGVLLRQIKTNFEMSKVLVFLGWLVAGYFASWTLYTPSHLSSRTYKYDINEAAQFSALCSLAWALALSWLIFSCFADKKGYINIFLSSRPMIILSRISYTMYLTQFIVFFYNVGTVKTSTEFKINTSLNLTELAIVILISTLLTLLVDMPAQKIKNILFKSHPNEKDFDTSSESNNIKNTRENSLENTKKVTISENIQILNDKEGTDDYLYSKYRQLSTESDDFTEDTEEIIDEDEEIVQKLENNRRQFSTESETISEPLTEDTEDFDDEEIVETLENRIRQSSVESQPSLEDIEDIIYDEEAENTTETKSKIKSQYSTEDIEELEHDEESRYPIEYEEELIENEPVHSSVKTQLSSETTKGYEEGMATLQSQQSTEDIEDITEGNVEGFVTIKPQSPEDNRRIEHEEKEAETTIQPVKDTEEKVERFVFRFRPKFNRTDLTQEETKKPSDDDEEIVRNLESNVRKSSKDDNSASQPLNDDE